MSESESNEFKSSDKPVTYSDVASKLLNDRLYLTALELHAELLESGKDIKRLRDFFSNPGNFETHTQDPTVRMSRSGSQATLDSLDLTRYSEDGCGTDEKLAVLEFELRKAKETINSLRNNLTVAAESENSTPDKGCLKTVNVGCIKPHEQRALNFLINEYLLMHGYKLTSITFADENQSQDFDDWDDVGLNIPKFPELLSLYREGLKNIQHINSLSCSTQTDISNHNQEVDGLLEEVESLRTQNNLLRIECDELKESNLNLSKINQHLTTQISSDQLSECDVREIQLPVRKGSISSDSPDRFEIIDKTNVIFSKAEDTGFIEDNDSPNASEWTNLTIMSSQDAPESSHRGAPQNSHRDAPENFHRDAPQNSHRDAPESSHRDAPESSHQDAPEKRTLEDPNKKENLFDSEIFRGNAFMKEVFDLCYADIFHKYDENLFDLTLNCDSLTNESLIHTLSNSLLRIIPNIILNKREDVIPLIVSAVHFNPEPKERDKLLQQLFNLKKKPLESERTMILAGIVAIAKCSGESLVDNELLPQCWEQLNHKYVERRMLVAEACIALIPYVSSQIRNSLIFSIFQQMLEDREESVREVVIKGLSLLVALCNDCDKYNQCEELILNTLNDPSDNIVNLSTQILLPVLGKWAFDQGWLQNDLLRHLLHKLNSSLKELESQNKVKDKILRIIHVIEVLVSFVVMSCAVNKTILCSIEENTPLCFDPEWIKFCDILNNPLYFYTGQPNAGLLLYEFDKYILENPSNSWKEIDWVLDMLIPDLLNNLSHVDISQYILFDGFIKLFSTICRAFGRNFTKFKIRPLFQIQIQNLDQILSNFNQYSPSLNVIPVYLISVLTHCDDQTEISNMLKKFLCTLPLYGAPLDCLEIAVKGLCEANFQEVVVTSLWEGVVDQRPLIRSATANLFSYVIKWCKEDLVSLKITPAVVTLASDNDMLVRTAAVTALGTLVVETDIKEVHDKVYLQLQSFLSDQNLTNNHTLLRQIIVTLGTTAKYCSISFLNEVILPHLCKLSSFMVIMNNETRKIDLALALIEAYSIIVYIPLSRDNIEGYVLSGLRCLQTVSDYKSLIPHKEAIASLIKECESKCELPSPQSPTDIGIKLSQNVNQSVEEMRHRMSKIFIKPGSKPNSLPNLQAMFKKK